MPSSILNSDDGVISGTSGLKSSGGDDGTLAVQSNGTEVAKFKTTELVINDGGANYDFRVEGDADANLLFVDASADRVGIGTSSPGRKLSVNGSIGATEALVDGNITLTVSGTGYGQLIPSVGALTVDARNGSNLIFQVASTEKARVTDSSGLLVNCTAAPSASVGGFQVNSSSQVNTSIQTTDPVIHYRFFNPNGQVGSITTSGSATAYNTSSDYRLKENIAPMTSALSKVAQLKPCTYTWKVDGSAGQGFIAHELAEVVPQCVTGEKDAVDVEGEPIYQGVDTSFLVATLTAAIQELKAELDEAKARIAALEAVPGNE
jgi:hypothetical protein